MRISFTNADLRVATVSQKRGEELTAEGYLTRNLLNVFLVMIANVSVGDREGTAFLKADLFSDIGVPVEEAWNTAILNTAKEAVIKSLCEVTTGEAGEGPLVIMSPNLRYGAGILACPEFLRNLWTFLGDFYIIPSSVHEVIVFPKGEEDDEINLDFLKEMVVSANANTECVSEHDFLSNSVFEYTVGKGLRVAA